LASVILPRPARDLKTVLNFCVSDSNTAIFQASGSLAHKEIFVKAAYFIETGAILQGQNGAAHPACLAVQEV
jgi:hypothetical protein